MLDRGARQSLAYTHRGTGRSPAYYYLFCIAEFLAGILLKKAKKLLLFSLRCDIMSKLSETAPNTTLEKSRSWSSARDWKSRNRQKRFESSNLSFSAKKEVTFVYQKLLLFYPSRRLGISSPHEVRCISSRSASRPCISSRVSVHFLAA